MKNSNKEEYIGQIINGKIIIDHAGMDKHGQSLYKYECSCGNIATTYIYSIKKFNTCNKCKITRLSKFNNKELAIKRAYNNYRHSAKRKNLQFDLTLEEFVKLTSSNCHYCYAEPKSISKRAYNNKVTLSNEDNYIYNGLGRVDSSKGYAKTNIVTCCVKCNKAKLDMSIKEFKEHIIKIYEHWIKK